MRDIYLRRLLNRPLMDNLLANGTQLTASVKAEQGIFPMTECVVLITGALTGIGRATAFAFASEGAKLVVSGRHQDKGDELAAELRRTGAEAEFVKADVRHETDVANLVDKTVSRFGRLDVAVNNAGREGLAPIGEITLEHYNEVFDTNVLGTPLSLKHEFRVMQAQRKGSIVNVSSVYGHIGFAGGGSVYVGSKFAIEGITKSAALEVARRASASTLSRQVQSRQRCFAG
jgi:NAD(P)-dependent dehydrogenase (short-subunit alcohol dehydrogenase family)